MIHTRVPLPPQQLPGSMRGKGLRAPEPLSRAVGGTVLPGETPPPAGLWQAGKREVGLSQRPPDTPRQCWLFSIPIASLIPP